jgi:hypothetical protein
VKYGHNTFKPFVSTVLVINLVQLFNIGLYYVAPVDGHCAVVSLAEINAGEFHRDPDFDW